MVHISRNAMPRRVVQLNDKHSLKYHQEPFFLFLYDDLVIKIIFCNAVEFPITTNAEVVV